MSSKIKEDMSIERIRGYIHGRKHQLGVQVDKFLTYGEEERAEEYEERIKELEIIEEKITE